MVLIVLQLNRQLSLLSRRQVLPSLGTVLKEWTAWNEKPPTGFEKYFDKDNKSKSKKSDSPQGIPNPFDNAFKKRINRMSQGYVLPLQCRLYAYHLKEIFNVCF
jgi:hypothetical protein